MLDWVAIRHLIEQELEVDRAGDDITSRLLGDTGKKPAKALISAKESGVFSGEMVCRSFPQGMVRVVALVTDGTRLEPGMPVARLEGPIADCLAVERTLLNLLCHLSGVATLTRKFVDAVHPHPTKILATRKTLPGLRELQLLAVKAGGGFVHRRSLSDGILFKDNHLTLVPEAELVSRARASKSPLHRVEVEVQSFDQLDHLLQNPPDIVMLDNFDLEQVREAVRRIGGRCEIEVSGRMTVERVAEIAAVGVHYISVGRLTHSAPSLDLSMDLIVGGT